MTPATPSAYRHILVQMDAATFSYASLDTAVELAARLEAEVRGVFVVDRGLVAAGGLEFVREFRLSSAMAQNFDAPTVHAQINALARSMQRRLETAGARHNLSVAFEILPDEDPQDMERKVSRSDLTIVESKGRLQAHLYRHQWLARTLTIAPGCSTLLLKGGRRPGRNIIILCDRIDNLSRTLMAARSFTQGDDRKIMLLPCLDPQVRSHDLLQSLQEEAGKTAPEIRIGPAVTMTGAAILGSVPGPDDLLVLAVDGPLFTRDQDARMLLHSQHPLLLAG